MKYKLRTTSKFDKQIKKLDKFTGKTIINGLIKKLENTDNPRKTGKALVGNLSGTWRYRVICKIEDKHITTCSV